MRKWLVRQGSGSDPSEAEQLVAVGEGVTHETHKTWSPICRVASADIGVGRDERFVEVRSTVENEDIKLMVQSFLLVCRLSLVSAIGRAYGRDGGMHKLHT